MKINITTKTRLLFYIASSLAGAVAIMTSLGFNEYGFILAVAGVGLTVYGLAMLAGLASDNLNMVKK